MPEAVDEVEFQRRREAYQQMRREPWAQRDRREYLVRRRMFFSARGSSVPLKRAGVRIGLHAKSMVVDEGVGVVGTHNFDPRGDNYNTESALIIRDRGFAAELAASIRGDIAPANSWVIAPRERNPILPGLRYSLLKVSEHLPVFDLMPVRYATSYEFVPGPDCPAPLRIGDPRFHDCYRAVGDFPEVNVGPKWFATRILTAFGAGVLGLLALRVLRRLAEPGACMASAPGMDKAIVTRDDIRLRRFEAASDRLLILTVDASGSAAAARLAEAKGACELLLAEGWRGQNGRLSVPALLKMLPRDVTLPGLQKLHAALAAKAYWTCRFTNTKPRTLTVTKALAPAADNGSFVMTANGTAGTAGGNGATASSSTAAVGSTCSSISRACCETTSPPGSAIRW